MTFDYDVVIIGGSLTGRYAAAYAAKMHAKVALLEAQISDGESYYHQIIQEISLSKAPIWSEVMLNANSVASRLEQMNSLANLATLGVEVIIGNGEFLGPSPLVMSINGRLLHARTYLLANKSIPKTPQIPGLEATGYLTLDNIWQYVDKANLPQNWVIIGGTPASIEISQTLAHLGCNVTLIAPYPSVLSHLEPEIAQMLITQLEVDGVQILTHTAITQVQQFGGKKVIQLGDMVIKTNEILVAYGQQANLESLNLAAVGVRQHQCRLIVNHKLQTTNHRIYACGSVIGGYDLVNIANYEAKLALKNALFMPIFSVNYTHIPWIICSQPMLTQVGLTAAQAKIHYPQNQENILVLKQYFKVLALAQTKSALNKVAITGICQFVVLENGQILGASILGTQARELIDIIVLAMKKNILVKDIADLAPVYPGFTEILVKTAQEWHNYRLQKKYALQELLANFFYFRRDWEI